MDCETAKALIEQHLDGELTDDLHRQVAEHLASCLSCAALAATTRRIGDELRANGSETADPELVARVRGALRDERPAERAGSGRHGTGWRLAAAVAVASLLSSGTTFAVMRQATSDAMIGHDLLTAHVRALLQERPTQVASSNQHVVKPWFAGRVEFAPSANDLTAQGFPLVGGRVDYVDGRRVAVAVYRRNLHWIDVFMWPDDKLPLPADARRDGFHFVSWTRDGIACSAVSDVNIDDLAKLKALLNPPVGAWVAPSSADDKPN